MEKLMNRIFKSPKTTIAGVYIVLITVAFKLGYIDDTQFEQLVGVGTALGFIIAKDADVTNATHTEQPE